MQQMNKGVAPSLATVIGAINTEPKAEDCFTEEERNQWRMRMPQSHMQLGGARMAIFSEPQFLRALGDHRSRLRQGDVSRLLFEILDTCIDQLRPLTDAYKTRIDCI